MVRCLFAELHGQRPGDTRPSHHHPRQIKCGAGRIRSPHHGESLCDREKPIGRDADNARFYVDKLAFTKKRDITFKMRATVPSVWVLHGANRRAPSWRLWGSICEVVSICFVSETSNWR